MRLRHISQAAATLAIVATAAGCGSAGTAEQAAADIPTPEPAITTDSAPTTSESTTTGTSQAAGDEMSGDAADDTDETAAPTETTEAPSADTPGVIAVSLSADEQIAADDPVAQAIIAAFPPGFTPPSDDQARCVGGKIVNELGTDRLAELGVTAESIDIFGATDFEPAEVDSMVDVLFECVDVEIMVASMFAPSAGPETADCFADFVDEDLIRELAAPFLGGGAIDAEFFLEQVQAANSACLPAD